jgi:hypothetical protein
MGMEILFMTFMVIVSIMALFAVMVVLRDVVREVFDARREKYAAEAAKRAELQSANALAEQICAQAVEPKAEPVPQPVEEPVEEPEAPAEPEAAPAEENDDGTIKFATGQQQTLDEKYLALPYAARGWYDEIIKYASAIEGSKRVKNARYEEYKVGKNRLVRLLIKRGIINCEFILHNMDFKAYVSENKINVKQSATTMLVETAETVDAVKNSIDIVVASIAEEKEYKKQLAREKRRAARAAGKAAEAEAEAEKEAETV